MSCKSLKHRFDEERKKGLTFARTLEIYQDVEGSVAAHRTELEELIRSQADQDKIRHLQEHITEGERLIQEIQQLHLH